MSPKTSVLKFGMSLLLLVACGRDSGDHGTPVTPDPVAPTPSEDSDSFITGHFFLANTSTPATGYELWVIDHTAHSLQRALVDATGLVQIAVSDLVDGHTYSLHLVSDFRLLGTFDLSQEIDGVQNAITYAGGYGFSLGETILNRDTFGRLNTPVDLTAQVAGGFRLDQTQSGLIEDMGSSDSISSFSAGSQLFAFDALTVFNSFYNRSSNSPSYAAALASLSRIKVSVQAATSTSIKRVFALDGGAWLYSGRLSLSDDAPKADGDDWKVTDFELLADGQGGFSASIFTGSLLPSASLLLLKAQPSAGPLQDLSAYLPHVFSMIPQVTGISLSGGVPASVSYSSTTAQNGLTKPFCFAGQDIALTLAMPLDETGVAWSEGAAPMIDAVFDYYVNKDGQSVFAKPETTHFSTSYQADFSAQTDSDGYARSWLVNTRRLRYAVPTTAAAATSHTITLPSELFLNTLGSTSVGLVRIKLYVRWPGKDAESATLIWVKKSC